MEFKYRKIRTEGKVVIKSTITLSDDEIDAILRIRDHEFLHPENYRPEGSDTFEKLVSFSHWVKDMSWFAMLWENRDNPVHQGIISGNIKRRQYQESKSSRRKRR